MKDQIIKNNSSHPKEEEALKTMGRGFTKVIALLLIAGGMLVEFVIWRYFLPEQYIGTHSMALLSILLGLAGWVALERRRKQPVSKILTRLAVRLAVLFGVLAGIVFGVLGWVYAEVKSDAEKIYSEKKFDRDVWLEWARKYDQSKLEKMDTNCGRGKMYADLATHYLKKGMSVAEVRELLGRASRKRILRNKGKIEECLEYALGVCESHSALWMGASKYLLVCFNQKNKTNAFFKSGYLNEDGSEPEIIVNKDGVEINGE